MDYLRRLGFGIFLCACVVLLAAPRLASAQSYQYTPKVLATTGGTAKQAQTEEAQLRSIAVDGGSELPGQTYGSMQNACQAAIASYNGRNGTSWVFHGFTGCSICNTSPFADPIHCQGCNCTVLDNGTGLALSGVAQVAKWVYPSDGTRTVASPGSSPPTRQTFACPAQTVEGAGGLCYSYICPEGTPPWESDPADSTRCRRPDRVCPAAGQTFSGEAGAGPRPTGFAGGVPVFCAADGCSYNAAGTFQPFGQPGQLVAPYTSRGEACGNGYPALGESGPSQSGTNEQSNCGPGLVKGTINGTTVCVRAGAGVSTQTTSSSTTTNNSDGTSTVTTTTKTYTTTTDENGNQSTQVATTVSRQTFSGPNGTGTPTGTENSAGTEEGGSFCDENPDHLDCKPRVFGGACSGEWNCEGDAVVCAIAKEQHRRNCKFYEAVADTSESATQSEGVEALKGVPADGIIAKTETAAQAFGTAERINAGACPSPSSFSTPLGNVVIDWGHVCTAAGWFSWIILASCIAVGSRIFIGGIA